MFPYNSSLTELTTAFSPTDVNTAIVMKNHNFFTGVVFTLLAENVLNVQRFVNVHDEVTIA